MARNQTPHRTIALVLLILALACCGLTACSSASNPTTQARAHTPQEVAAVKRRYEEIVEIFNCARRHGIHLPQPTAAGLNVSGVKGRSREEAVSACYQTALKKVARQEHAGRAK
jgi:hypothetical protein